MGDDKDQTSNTAVETYPRFRRRGSHGPLGFSSGVSSREDVFFQVTLTTVSGEDEEGGCPAVRTLRLLYSCTRADSRTTGYTYCMPHYGTPGAGLRQFHIKQHACLDTMALA